MTLFGRDSLLTSWMTMLVDPDLALGTLQTLARFQGEEVDPRTEEEPGRILHEMRFGETASLALGGGRIYYGTVDATPLFVMLVGELSRWGNRREEVDALLPAADRALEWITDYGDKDGDGYVEYQRTTDRGLQNQGWKDSWDSMRFADGTLAATPIALCEVQGYVYAALVARAHCATEAGDHELAATLRARADELKRRFNEDFWVDTDDGGYFALGLDRDKRRIDGLGSNMGHCLWTGIVDEEKAPLVARALLSDGDVQRWGMRTLSTANGGLQPDLVPLRQRVAARQRDLRRRADALRLRRRGAPRDARPRRRVAVVRRPAARAVLGHRPRARSSFPVSYPTSCSPQAWAAASPLLFLRTLLRFEPDIRNSKLHLAPAVPDWIGTLRLERHPAHGRPARGRGRGRGRAGAQVPDGPDDRVRPALADVAEPAFSGLRAGQEQGEVAVGVGPPLDELHARRRRARRSTPLARELRAHLGAHLLARGERHVELERARRAPSASRVERRRISIHSCSASKTATCSNASTSKSASSSRFITREHVLVELGGDALRVVVGGFEAVDVLHEVEAEQQVVVGAETVRDLAQELGAGRRAAGCRSCRRGTRRAGGRRAGSCRGDASKSPTTACTSTPGTPRRPRRPRRAASARSRRTGTKRVIVPASRNASSRMRVLSEVPEPSSTSVSARVTRRDLVARARRGSPARNGSGSTRGAG